jgi:hypothetical protein
MFLKKLSSGKHMKKFCLLTLFLASGCASIQPVKFSGPTGKTAYSMKCSGMGRTLEQCYVKAGEVCPNGYSIVDNSVGYARVGAIGAPQYQLAIECK